MAQGLCAVPDIWHLMLMCIWVGFDSYVLQVKFKRRLAMLRLSFFVRYNNYLKMVYYSMPSFEVLVFFF